MSGWVYMMSNRPRGTIYVGVTSDLEDRGLQHRNGAHKGFTSRYRLKLLVWHERHPNIVLAIQREKALKRHPREWKINLIEGLNPSWHDLFDPEYKLDNPYRPHPNTQMRENYE